MIRQNATNTFTGGMVSDLEPLSTPNNVLTDCLNGTISTFNGNTDALQTDIGNAKIGVHLPEGYIPLGSASLDGIIYIVSYNPRTEECQIGSFPSPQRDFGTEDEKGKENKKDVKLSNGIFEDTSGIKTYLYLGNLGQKVNPGDLFYTYFNKVQKDDFLHLYDVNAVNKGYLKLSIGYLDSNNQIHKLKDINYETEYTTEGATGETIVRNLSVDYNPNSDDKNSKYKVYNTKVSGDLILIAELIKPDIFNVSIKHKVNKKGSETYYAPEFSWSLSNEEEDLFKTTNIHYIFEIPSGDKTNTYDVIQSISTPTYEHALKFDEFQITEQKVTQLEKYNKTEEKYEKCNKASDFFQKLLIQENSTTNITITVIPELEYGKIDVLAQKFDINLKDVNTGKIEIKKYQYLNEYSGKNQNTYQFYLQLNAYPEVDKPIEEVRIDLYSKSDIKETIVNNSVSREFKPINKLDSIPIISNNGSYHGTFTTDAKKYSENIQINDGYIARIVAIVNREEVFVENRFFFTDNYWNDLYKDERIDDFGTITYSKTPNVNFTVKDEPDPVVKNSKIYGKLQTDVDEKNYSTQSYNCYKTKRKIESTVSISYPESRNWAYDMNITKITPSSPIITYKSEQQFDGASLLIDESIFNQDYATLEDDIVEIDGSDSFNKEIEKIEHPYYVNVSANASGNTLNITYKDNRFEKIYTKKGLKECKYRGSLKPLAYNDVTYSKYNMRMNSYNTYVNNTIKNIEDESVEINKYISHTDFLINIIDNKYYISCYDPDKTDSTYTKKYYDEFLLEVSNEDPTTTSETGKHPIVDKQLVTITDSSENLARVYLKLMSKDNSDINVSYYFQGQIVKVDQKYYFNVLQPKSLSLQNDKFDISLTGSVVNPLKQVETKPSAIEIQKFFPRFIGVYNMGNHDGISIGSIDSDKYTVENTGIKQTEMPRSRFFFANSNICDNLHIAGWDNNLLFAIYDCDKAGRNLDSDINNKKVSNPIRMKGNNEVSTVALIVFIKSNNVFIPIKTVEHIQNVKSLEKGTWKGVYDFIVQNLEQYFQDIASILNSLYHYDNSIINVQKYLPQENIWTYNAEYKTTIPVTCNYEIVPKVIKNIKSEETSREGNTSKDFEIKYNQDNVLIQSMIDYILQQSDTTQGIALYDINGIDIISGISDSNLNSDEIYLIKNDKINKSFVEIYERTFTLTESGKLNIQKTSNYIEKLDTGINVNFKIEDGILTLKNPDYIGRKFKSHVNIGSFQNFGLLTNKYNTYEYS